MSAEAVLSIAGIDPGGGAGLLADIKVFHQLGVTGFGVCTAITYQNSEKIFGVDWQSWSRIKAQLDPLFESSTIPVVKIGIIESLELLDQLLTYLEEQTGDILVVWDPVISATSGYQFHSEMDKALFKRVLQKVHVITPNLQEFEMLCEVLESSEIEDWISHTHVIVKGGHGSGSTSEDVLYRQTGQPVRLQSKRLDTVDKRGTGCAFSSALAAGLQKGNSLEASFTMAKEYVFQLLQSSESRLGNHHLIRVESI